jgi:hypothetical protein
MFPVEPDDGELISLVKAKVGRSRQAAKDTSSTGSSGVPLMSQGHDVESSCVTTPQTKVRSEEKKVESPIVYHSIMEIVTEPKAQQNVDEEPVIRYDLEVSSGAELAPRLTVKQYELIFGRKLTVQKGKSAK